MSSFSVNKLFPNSKAKTGNMSVKTLFSKYQPEEHIPPIENIDHIIEEERQKRKQIAIAYRKMLNECIDLFKQYKKYGYLECMYEVKNFYGQVYIPDIEGCRNYISDKLREQGIDTFPISKGHIYMTWVNLEKNLKKKIKK
jgi:hypothetical protein